MNKTLLSALLVTTLIFSGAVKAGEREISLPQDKGHVEMMKHHKGFDKEFHEKMAKKIAEDLNLSDEQQNKAQKIRKEGRKKIKPLMDEMHNLREKIDKERKANMEEFEKILTPEQKNKFDEMKKNGPLGKKRFDKNTNHKMMKGMHKLPDEK